MSAIGKTLDDRTMKQLFSDPLCSPGRSQRRRKSVQHDSIGSPPGSPPGSPRPDRSSMSLKNFLKAPLGVGFGRRRSAPLISENDPLAKAAECSSSSNTLKQVTINTDVVQSSSTFTFPTHLDESEDHSSSSISESEEIPPTALTEEQEMSLRSTYAPIVEEILETCRSIQSLHQLTSKMPDNYSINQEQFALSLLIDCCQGYYAIPRLFEESLDCFHRDHPKVLTLGNRLQMFYYSAKDFERAFILDLIETQVKAAYPRELTARQIHIRSIETCERMLMQLHEQSLKLYNPPNLQEHIQAISLQLEHHKSIELPSIPEEENLDLLQALRTKLFIQGHSLGIISWDPPFEFDAFAPIKRFLKGDFSGTRLNQVWRQTKTVFMTYDERKAHFKTIVEELNSHKNPVDLN